jgi:hypothetical protein
MQKRKLMFIFISLILSVSVAIGQDACPTIVADALTATDSVCSGIGRNEACYGNIQITAELADPSLVFGQKGDVVQLTEIERLTLSPYVDESTEWGVALMNVQANIPDTSPGQGVTFLLYGDVDITNAGDAMEAFYFSSGIGTAGCNEASSGIIINTPEGVGTVSLIANDVTIELGSTAVLTAQPDDLMTIALTEGNAMVTADGVTQEFEGGFQVSVPVNEDLEATGAPSEPEAIPEETIEDLPDIMGFVETTESSDGDDSTDDADTELVGGNIVPLSGNWAFTMDGVEASAGCPPGMSDAMSSAPIPTNYVEFGDTFDLQTMMESTAVEGMPGNVIYDNPEPNVYTMAFSQEGVTLNWIMTLESPSLMTGTYSVDMSSIGMDCALSISYSITLQG